MAHETHTRRKSVDVQLVWYLNCMVVSVVVCVCVCVRSHYQRVHGKQMSLANTVHKMMADRELK